MNDDNNDHLDEQLTDEELELISGGLSNHRLIPVCLKCDSRVAVSGMNICAACFREQQLNT